MSGARVYLYAAGTGIYGAASTSLLGTGTTLSGLTQDSAQNYYATTDSNGNFTITGNYSCPGSNAQVYALAVGGNPGLVAGTNNTAITLLAAIGSCSTLNAASNIVISEVSTAASVTALQQFMVDDVHIGAPTTNVTGLQNAFLAVTNLYTVGTGAVRATPVSGSGSSPQAKVDTLGNILAPCVNSSGPTSAACSSLFAAATPSGTKPSDIAATMLMIAKNPGYNPTGLFQQINASAPFGPSLASAPNDFTLAVTFTGGGLTLPGDVVIDATGNAWTANCPTCAGLTGTDSIVGFSPLGAVLTGSTGFTSGIHRPQGIAFDESGNLWSVNDATSTLPDQVVKMSATTGADATGFPFSNVSVDSPLGIAIDATGSAWVSNQGNSVILEVSAAGAQVGSPYANSTFVSPTGIGIDGSGNVFAAGTGSSNISRSTPERSTLVPVWRSRSASPSITQEISGL